MSITANVGGVLKTLSKVTANVSGTLKELNTVHANVNGVLKKIFSNAPFKVLKGTLQSTGGSTAPKATDTSLTNVVITQACTARIKVHIDANSGGNNGCSRSVGISGSDTQNVTLTCDISNPYDIGAVDWYGEIQLAAGTYNFSFAFFNVSISNQGTPNVKVTYSTSTITYEISFS